MICRDTYNCRKSNRLTTLSGTGASEDSPTASTSVIYTYDANGNTTHDGRKNIDLTYDINGLLQTVSKNSTTKATYHYLADGTKFKTIAPDGTGRMYAGSMTYNIAASGASITSLDGADLAGGEGRIIAEVSGTTTTYKPIYYLKDHLGSIRTILNAQGEVIERNDYYPFGMRTTTGNTYPTFISTTTSNRNLYNSKEKQTIGDVNYLDYGTRMYDESIGRWTTQDPLSEKYYSTSQYTYCGNNPINIIDPNGTLEDWVQKGNKEIYWDENAKSQETTKKGETYMGKAVVVFNGSRDEKLGKGDNLFGEGAKLADIKVYGPKGENDISDYKGFTMSSDFKKYGAIDNGTYDVSYNEKGKSGKLTSHWAVNNCGPVDCLDGINPSNINPYSSTQKNGIYIHSSNKNGWAGGQVSTGCPLITPSRYNATGKLIKPGWNEFNKQLDGVKEFIMIMKRN